MASVGDGTWEFSSFGDLKPEHVKMLVDEARSGYDPDMRAQFVGRPGYEDREPLLPRIAFRVSPDLLAAAQRRADERDCALSELATAALREHLDRPAPVRDPSKDS
jgi:hypothetical protein